MAVTLPCPLMQMPAEITHQILVNVLVSLHSTTDSEPKRARCAIVHCVTRAPKRYWAFATSRSKSWSHKYITGDLRTLRDFLSLKLVSYQFYHAVPLALLEGQRKGIAWQWATCDWSTKPAPGHTPKPYGPCIIHGESNIHKSVLTRWDWPKIDETAIRIAKETETGYCATIDALCRLVFEAWKLANRHPWLEFPMTKRDPRRLMPDGVRWLDPDGHSVSYAGKSQVPVSWMLGITLLSAAAYWNLIPLAKRLLCAGFDPTADDNLLPPAMMLAAWAGNAEMLKLFQEHLPHAQRRHRGVNYLQMGWVGKADTTAIVGAAARGDVEMLKLAIFPPSSREGDQGTVVSRPCGASWRNQTFLGQALEVAQEYTTDWQVYLYIARLFDPVSYLGDFFRSSQRVAIRHLQQCAVGGHLAMAHHLVDAGTRAPWSCSVLELAARRGYTEAVGLLLATGMEAKSPGEDFNMALVLAANNGHLKIVRALLAHGAGVTNSAVLGALRANSIDLVELLLAQYPGDYIKDLTGTLELMMLENLKSMARLLRRIGVPTWHGHKPDWLSSRENRKPLYYIRYS